MENKLPGSANVPSAASFAVAKVSDPALAIIAPVPSIHARGPAVVVTIMSIRNAWIPEVAEPTSKATIRGASVGSDGYISK